ncbi:hypothetical protein [Burkholderia contaminans]|nr:hypothetical protein [Burkholderia contaminans]UAC71341.1 hypothetical protein K8B66_03580 [Burkholderia contaminans]
MLLKSVLSIPVLTKLNRSRRNEVVKKVVDGFKKTVDNLASLLLKTQRCRKHEVPRRMLFKN